MNKSRSAILIAILLLIASSAMAQVTASPDTETTTSTTETTTPEQDLQDPNKPKCPKPAIQNFRPTNQCGVNMFEPPKETEEVPFEKMTLDWGVAFSQTIQALKHRNTAVPRLVNGTNANELADIGPGFNLAAANLYLNAQLAPGIRLALTTYLSSRHHNEVWVKDGYVQMDQAPVNIPAMNGLINALWSNFITVKVGHMEVNYGDLHFRRTDNGNGVYNPFIGNYLLDAFTTEIGGEVYLRAGGVMAMASLTGGEIKGNVLNPDRRSPAVITKFGFDRQLTPDLRFRLMGSNYQIKKSPAQTLYAGDRAGSPYFYVLENTQATATAQFSSGTINPGFREKVSAYMLNPFVKYKGVEFFGVAEYAKGKAITELRDRVWRQFGGEVVYRFSDENVFVGARYNHARGQFQNMADSVSINRTQIGAGWFVNKYLLMKGEYVIQNYKGFPTTDIRNGGRFQGPIFDAVLAF